MPHDSSTSSESVIIDVGKSKELPKTNKCLSCVFGPVVKFFTSEPEQYSSLKMFLGFPFGALIGYGLYNLVILPMDLGEDTRNLLGALLVFGMSAGYSLSAKFRCFCILLVPTFMGKAGRSYIGTFAIAYLIAGPIENLVDNAQDITRSLTCSAALVANQTAAKWKFRLQPVGNVFKDMADEGWMLNNIGKKVNKAFVPVKSEIRGDEGVAEMVARTKAEDDLEGGTMNRAGSIERKTKTEPNDDDSKKIENKYKKKVEFECEDIYNKGVQACRKVFDNLENRCKDKIPAPLDKFLCKLVNVGFLCRLVEPLGKALGGECKPDDVVRPSFGKMYKKSEEATQSMDDGFDVQMQYKVVEGQENLDYTSVEEMRSDTMHHFKYGRTWVEFIMLLVKRLLGFTFLLVIISAYKYCKSYVTDIRFDNMYISSYFRKIDARRKLKEKKVLLPLKKIEKNTVIFPTSLKLMKAERKKLGKGSVLVFTRAFLSGLVFLVANLFYTVLDIIRTQSRVDYRQTGLNSIDVKVGGTGFMSTIVRLFLNGLNTKSKLDRVSSNLECLPRPVKVDPMYYLYVFGVFFIVWSLILMDAYALRLRAIIAGFFFRKREKQRILHLYNTMMKRRKFFLKDMRRKVKRRAKKLQLSEKSGVLFSLSKQFPRLCAFLKHTEAGKDKCLICEEKEKADFETCETEACKFLYCPECWEDLNEKCYACLPLEEFSSTDSDSMTGSEGDDDI